MKRIEILIGEVYGRLTVICKSPSIRGDICWDCVCSCGNTLIVSSSMLKSKHVQSCGCLRKEVMQKTALKKRLNLIGERFGRLTVLEHVGIGPSGESRFKCVCDCGGEIVSSGHNLKNGHSKSCGCFQDEARGKSLITHHKSKTLEYQLLCHAIKRADKYGLSCDFAPGDIEEVLSFSGFIPSVCPITNKPILGGEGKLCSTSPSLDKVIPSLGYTMNNIHFISLRGNMIKRDGTPEEWYNIYIGLNSKCAIYQEDAVLSDEYKLRVAKEKVKNAGSNAKKCGLPFNITPEDILPLFKKYCPLLGMPLDYVSKGHFNGYATPELDKIAPEFGYVRGNIQLISSRANKLKSNASFQEISNLCDYLDKHLQKESK